MRNWSIGHLVIWAIAAGAGTGAARADPAAASVPDVRVRASVDRTAVWVADRVTYTIELVCRPGVDILDEDLSRDKLRLDGLDVIATDTNQTAAADGTTTHRYAYTLTSYQVAVPELQVQPVSVRYYVKRTGVRLQDATPAGEVQVPGAVIELRSTLPDQQDTAVLRDRRAAAPRARRFAVVQPVGLGLVIASFVPVLLWGVAVVRERRHRAVHRSARQVRAEERASLESARLLDVGSVDARREVYTRIDAVVRDHLAGAWGLAGATLTPGEVAPALADRRTAVAPQTIAALLAECARARYGPPDALPSADDCREALARAEELLAAR